MMLWPTFSRSTTQRPSRASFAKAVPGACISGRSIATCHARPTSRGYRRPAAACAACPDLRLPKLSEQVCGDGEAQEDSPGFYLFSTETAMRALALFLFTMFVAGCVTQAERAAQVQRDVDDMILVYGPGCEKLGYKTDSDPWRDCVLRLSTKDRLER